ncbi:MAG: hypothetical protein NC177_17695 [Ruminococcus flavefaciens]|nr:hypothetical protein [Ruminococcus flavefaciens]
MFTEIKQIVSDHMKSIDSMKAVFIEQKKKCYESTQYTTVFKDKMYAEIKNTYDADRMAQIAETKRKLDIAFSSINDRLEEAITVDIGQETIAELQVLSDVAVSEFEINAYAKKFAGKYKALRLINNIAKASHIPFSYVTDVEIIDDLNDLKAMIIALINEYHGNVPSLYQSQLVYMSVNDSISEEHNVFDMTETKFNNFMMPSVTVKTTGSEE